MKRMYIGLALMMVVILSGCSNTQVETNNTETHEDKFVKVDKQHNEETSEENSEESSEENNEESEPDYIDIDIEELNRNPDDFRVDTVQTTPEEQLKDIIINNEEYITNAGLNIDNLLNANWEYRSTEDLYSIVAYDGTNFHAVVVSVTNNTLEIDPE